MLVCTAVQVDDAAIVINGTGTGGGGGGATGEGAFAHNVQGRAFVYIDDTFRTLHTLTV